MIRLFRAGLTTALALLLTTVARAADMTWTYAVQASATASVNPPRVELNWPTDPFPIHGYSVHRKLPGETEWGEGVPLAGDATRFSDENVEPGRIYEYQIIKHGAGYTGYGYIAVGVHAPLVDDRGRVILVVDREFTDALPDELARLERDLAGDGWTVVRLDVSRSDSPVDVKAAIRREYDASPARTRAIFLLGRIPIVRSGNLNVDGHAARPMPADTFYGDMDGVWTDANNDGIYDQNTIPSSLELQVGRVDFADLPGTFSPFPYPGEREMMKRYLDKNHAYRQASLRPKLRALIGGLSDANGQAYSASAFRSFSAIVGNTNLTIAHPEVPGGSSERWISLLSAHDYLWVFGAGAGSDFTVGSLGTHGIYDDVWASDFLELKAKGTFYMMFGSWFSDWTKPDNILRTVLATPGHGLAAMWTGRPHQFHHYMGVGETIGYGMRLSQNNQGLYQNQVQRQLRGVHVSLLGDPTLRMPPLAPPTELNVSAAGAETVLAWRNSPDAVLGYHVYRGASPEGPYVRLTDQPISETRFADARRPGGSVTYQVRAVALITGASGTYFDSSQGAFAGLESSASFAAPPPDLTKSGDIVWIDDALPPGATGNAENDRWNWVSDNPPVFSGARAHQSDLAPGRHHHFFGGATTPLAVGAGDTLFAYVYLDPANPPRQIMLTWFADHWEHRAYWGQNIIEEGLNETAARRYAGDLPPPGRWARLEVSAQAVGLEGHQVTGMGFTLFDGRVTWDRAGKSRP